LLRQHEIDLVSFRRIKQCRRNAGVVRGLQFQIPPAAQVNIGAGSILDVAVNIRRGSPDVTPTVKTSLRRYYGSQVGARDCASSPTSSPTAMRAGADFTFTGGGVITWHGFAEVCSRIAESYGITPLPWREALGGGHRRA
jgi:hypothetical protein